MNDELNIFFNKKWKNKYTVDWCNLCDVAIISCPFCEGTTCNSHSCDKCKDDFEEFRKYRRTVFDYLTKDEIKIYEKCLELKKFILQTIPENEKEINWRRLKDDGMLSNYDEELFHNEILKSSMENYSELFEEQLRNIDKFEKQSKKSNYIVQC